MSDSGANGEPSDGVPPAPGEFETESRWITWKASALRRLGGEGGEGGEAAQVDEPARPFGSLGDFRRWVGEAFSALLDVQFQRSATRTLLPLAYLLGLILAVAVPIAVVVLMWRVTFVLGILAVLVAIPLGLTIAAVVRLALEFLVNASRLATRVEHISDLADDLFQALSDVAEPVNQLSEDVRAVQFWRFRRGNSRK
ncbi:DUF4282 domain-containing protein [Nocardia shimofusensis]|uniref:DUF4282 domain-containing protein n=1 Tax=Nocardia shimofusensis TaxID=228596 RepID=UPI0008368A38|nr:DUF4282 domain-containing protein [Nocardia shimofusensis]